jgi:ethanolamine utilization protein EutN
MQLGTVVGHATATAKHPSLTGWRLLVVQPIASDGSFDGDPLLAVDSLGAGRGDVVLLTSDGAGTRDLVGSDTTPLRWMVLALPDGMKTVN